MTILTGCDANLEKSASNQTSSQSSESSSSAETTSSSSEENKKLSSPNEADYIESHLISTYQIPASVSEYVGNYTFKIGSDTSARQKEVHLAINEDGTYTVSSETIYNPRSILDADFGKYEHVYVSSDKQLHINYKNKVLSSGVVVEDGGKLELSASTQQSLYQPFFDEDGNYLKVYRYAGGELPESVKFEDGKIILGEDQSSAQEYYNIYSPSQLEFSKQAELPEDITYSTYQLVAYSESNLDLESGIVLNSENEFVQALESGLDAENENDFRVFGFKNPILAHTNSSDTYESDYADNVTAKYKLKAEVHDDSLIYDQQNKEIFYNISQFENVPIFDISDVNGNDQEKRDALLGLRYDSIPMNFNDYMVWPQ